MIHDHFEQAVAWRRDLHRHAQPAWTEFYATALIAEKLTEWGYDVHMGKEIIAAEKQLMLPNEEKLETEYRRAIASGANEKFAVPAKGGFTGVVGILKGKQPGPVVAFRFDIDSNDVVESTQLSHRPAKEGFVSEYPGYAHACGHDAHATTGLLLAQHLAENRDNIKGTVKFIFQPNEENLSGAVAMVEKGLLDNVDYLLGGHVGINLKKLGQIALNVHSFMAVNRFEITLTGRPSHAAMRPDEGKNALLGACTAITNLYAIARHGLGASRINVGFLNAGTTWNVIADRAYFWVETRGVSNEINEYMVSQVKQIIAGAAAMYGLEYEIKPAAMASCGQNSPELVALGTKVADSLSSVTEVIQETSFNASEDITLMMDRVQQRGGKALFVLLGTPIFGGHHNSSFDIDEKVIQNGAEFFAALYNKIIE